MGKTKFSHKVIAVFLTLNFLTTIIPVNQLYANNNGPKSPEAGSFEPVDATDMVSLLTGDVNYVLPLLDIPSPEGGYPLVLSYHGGIAYDQDATWAGLGWNLNPGVINRTINGYPDDWKGGLVRNRNYYKYEVESINVSLGVGERVSAEIGIGYSWDSNGSQSGSVSLSITDAKSGGGAQIGVGYHSSDGWSANAGVSLSRRGGKVGFGIDSNGNANGSIGYRNGNNSIGISFGTSGLSIGANVKGIGKASYSSNNSVSADVTTMEVGVKIPLAPATFLRFGYTKVKFEKDETYLNRVWGPLHYNDLNDNPRVADDVTYGKEISTEHNRDFYMDTYDQPLPETEKEIVSFDDTFEKYQHSFTNPAYDNYVVNAQGLSGTMKPRLLENAYLIGKGYKIEYDTNNNDRITDPSVILGQIQSNAIESNNPELALHALSQSGGLTSFIENLAIDYLIYGGIPSQTKSSAIVNHHFNLNKRFDKRFGNNLNDLHFYFDHQLHSNLLIDQNSINTNAAANVSDVNHFFTGSHVNQIGRVENSNFIETFTNQEISSLINTGGTFFESKDFNRTNEFGAKPSGIGAYRITTPDGKTYHYSQPVYQYEELYRQLTPKADSETNNPENFSEHKFYHEQRRTEPYATHWMLTAITGPDYVKTSDSNIKYPTEGDYGYWIRFDYGSWTDGYIWRTPQKEGVYNNLTFDKTNGAQDYSWGRKQLVYLNKIVTRSHTALFVKSVRDDNEGAQIGISNSSPFNPGRFPSYEGDHNVYYPKQKSLKLDEIILIKSEDDTTLMNNNYGNLINNPNSSITVDWNTMSDISYGINKQDNILDTKDLSLNSSGYSIYDKAQKVIRLNQDYSLAKNVDENLQGRLTLKSVDFLGKKATSYMPAYQFNYLGEDVTYNPCEDYSNCSKDAWGYDKNDVALWSMDKIKTPLGSEIRIEYEEDDYYTEAFARRFWTEGLTFKVLNHNPSQYKIVIKNSPDFVTDAWVDFRNFFELNEKAALDLWMVKRKTETSGTLDDCDRFGTAFNLNPKLITDELMPTVLSVSQNYLELVINKNVGYGNMIYKPVSGWKNDDILIGQELWQSNTCPSTGNYDSTQSDRGDLPSYLGCKSTGSSSRSNHVMYYGLIANKTPIGDTGGGIRAKSIATYSDTGDFFKVKYSYNDPYKERTSGITSYAPVRGYKYITYQAELPGPKVNYEFVTMDQEGMNGESLGRTVYHFDVLKPAVDIFSKNLEIGNHFKSEVTENNLPKNTKGADVKLLDNTAMIGSLLEVSEYNSEKHLITKKTNIYKGFDELANTNRGSLQESFLSMKSIYDFQARYVKLPFNYGVNSPDGSAGINVSFTKNLYLENASTLNVKKRFANVSTKITYPLIQDSKKIIGNGFKTTSWFLNPDSKTGEYLTTKTQLSDGTYIKTDKVPAYIKYPEMGSKVDNIANKHMLTQETMLVSSWSPNGNYSWETLDANITTWNNSWTYRDTQGNETTESGVWRKHKSFVWKDDINSERGTYVTAVDNSQDYFNWEEGIPTNEKWQNTSEITRYTHWSSPIETKDINGNYLSSKLAEIDSKVIAGGNASFTELFASGAEYNVDGTYLDQEIKGATYRTADAAHTGTHSLKISSGKKGFETKLKANEHSEGVYKISVWTDYSRAALITRVNINGVSKPFNGEVVKAGNWTQLNHYEPFSTAEQNVYVTVDDHYSSITTHVDDFRIHPVYSSMNTYVYDQNTDELIYVLDANNMGTKYEYDHAGRLEKTYKEVEADLPATDGGFKLTNQYKYNYKTASTVRVGSEGRR
ncbi:hypothetical protein [Tenacibaculum halocynthiae]|uniref:hypothetical protein n=1 Tax=Tenacibaculum halocynthiae TaxID=1254437 RepID=UPI003D660F17